MFSSVSDTDTGYSSHVLESEMPELSNFADEVEPALVEPLDSAEADRVQQAAADGTIEFKLRSENNICGPLRHEHIACFRYRPRAREDG